MDEIDRILSSEAQIEPSPELARRVLAAIQREAGAPPPIPFPWRRAAAAAALIALASAGAAATPGLREPTQRAITALSAISWSVGSVVLGALLTSLATLWAAWRAD